METCGWVMWYGRCGGVWGCDVARGAAGCVVGRDVARGATRFDGGAAWPCGAGCGGRLRYLSDSDEKIRANEKIRAAMAATASAVLRRLQWLPVSFRCPVRRGEWQWVTPDGRPRSIACAHAHRRPRAAASPRASAPAGRWEARRSGLRTHPRGRRSACSLFASQGKQARRAFWRCGGPGSRRRNC